MPYESGHSETPGSAKGARAAASSSAPTNPFLQFTDRARFQQLLSRAGSKAGPARLVSPLTIAARLQHTQRLANGTDAQIDEEYDDEA